MGSLEEEERLLQMVRDFIESSSSEPSPNFCSIQEKSTRLKRSIFTLQELLRKKTDVEMEVLVKISKYMKGKMEMKKTTSLKKWLVKCLRLDGLDASLCHTSWDTKPDCPCGNYEYIDILVEEGSQSQRTRLMVDIDFKSQFEVARPTSTYLQLSNTLPSIFVGNEEKLNRVISILCSAAETSLRESGLHIPPWRRVNYMQSKWLSDCCKKDPNNNHSISNTKPCFCSSINIVGSSSSSSSSHDQGLDLTTKKGMKFGKWAPPAVPVRMKKPQSKDIGGGGGAAAAGNGGGSGLLSSQFSNMSINCC